MMARALTMLGKDGDTTVVWDEDADEQMIPIIENKMAEGCAFFVVDARFFGLLPPKKSRLMNAEEARKHRALSIPDEDLARFVSDGAGDLVKTPTAPVKTTRRSKNAKEIAASESVAVRPKRGG